MVEQHANPREIAGMLDEYAIPQATVAEFAGFSQPLLSLFLSGKKGLSLNAQLALFKAVRWLIGLAESTKTPVDFSNIVALRLLWREHLRLECETELIDLADGQQT